MTTAPRSSLFWAPTPISELFREANTITSPSTTTTDPIEWALLAARIADAKGGTDPVVLEVGNVLAITDAFVITSAGNDRLVRALVNEIEGQIAEAGGPRPKRVEGLDKLEWVLMDYGDFVVHVFGQEARDFYELERLWSDVARLDWVEEKEQTAADG